MMRIATLAIALVALASTAQAQGGPGPGAEGLRRQVVQRFLENYRVEAGLTNEQYGKVQTIVQASFERRRAFQEQERGIVQALEGQMRPGVAANQDSVTALLDRLLQIQSERTEQARAEQREFAQFLTPVQRAQFVLAFTRLERQIEQVIQRRMGEGARPPGRIRNP
jgi:Spy/CpxP family protein refolding chaperone